MSVGPHSVQISLPPGIMVASMVKAFSHRIRSFASRRKQELRWGRVNEKDSKEEGKDEKLISRRELWRDISDTKENMYSMLGEIRAQSRALGTIKVMIFSPSSWMRLNNIGEQIVFGIKVSS